MKEIRYKNIDRLINPSQIAFIGGADAEVAINEAKRRGFKGSIWPVNPKEIILLGINVISQFSIFQRAQMPYF